MTDRRAQVATELATYAIDIALGNAELPMPADYAYEDCTGYYRMVRVVPAPIHAALCPALPGAVVLSDMTAGVHVCDACGYGFTQEDK